MSLVFAVARLGAQTPAAEELFQRAEAANSSGDLARAIALYGEFVEKYPDLVLGHANLGVVFAHAGRPDEAASQYQQALKLDPENPAIVTNLAILRYKQGHCDETARLLDPVVKAHPGKGQPLLLLAGCYVRMSKYREAIALLEPVYQQDSADRSVDYLYGLALMSVNETGKGAAVIDSVLRDGSMGEADLLVGAKLLASGDHHDAALTLRKAMERNPALPLGWSLLGRALLDDQDFDGAKDAFRRALKSDPNDFDANLYLGGALRHNGQFDEALPYLDKANRLRPDSPEAAYQMGALHAARGEFEAALKYLEPVAQTWPEFQQAHVQLALVYQKLHRIADSQREREIVLKLDEKQRQERKQAPMVR